MTEREYTLLADATLQQIEFALEAAGDDLDCERAPGGVLQVEFGDGSKLIVNRQAASQEIWVAAKSGGYHYRWDGQVWRDTRSGEELFAALAGFASAQAGRPLKLQP